MFTRNSTVAFPSGASPVASKFYGHRPKASAVAASCRNNTHTTTCTTIRTYTIGQRKKGHERSATQCHAHAGSGCGHAGAGRAPGDRDDHANPHDGGVGTCAATPGETGGQGSMQPQRRISHALTPGIGPVRTNPVEPHALTTWRPACANQSCGTPHAAASCVGGALSPRAHNTGQAVPRAGQPLDEGQRGRAAAAFVN